MVCQQDSYILHHVLAEGMRVRAEAVVQRCSPLYCRGVCKVSRNRRAGQGRAHIFFLVSIVPSLLSYSFFILPFSLSSSCNFSILNSCGDALCS